MAEVKWQARRVSDSVLVDVTADISGDVSIAPSPNAIEAGGLSNPVTEQLTVQPTSGDEDYMFFIQTPEDYDLGFGEVIQVQNFAAETVFGLNVFGTLVLGGSTAPGIEITATVNGRQRVLGTGSETYIITAVDNVGKNVFRVLPTGATIIGATAAPADASVPTGCMALWFDATNGAAKLMIKGKSANGTVVTGSVALA